MLMCGIMKIFISVHWQAQTLNYEVVPSLLMTLCAERVVCCVATRCLRHNNGHDAVPFNSVLWALLWDFWLFQSSDGFDNLNFPPTHAVLIYLSFANLTL